MAFSDSPKSAGLFMPSYIQKKDTLSALVDKLSTKDGLRSDQEKIDINIIIDQMNSLNITPQSSIEKDMSKLIDYCSKNIPADAGQLTVKICRVLSRIMVTSEVEIPEADITKLMKFSMTCIEKCEVWALSEILRCTSTFINNHGGVLPIHMLDCLLITDDGLLTKFVFDKNQDILIRKAALQCIENISTRSSRSSPFLDDYYCNRCLCIFLQVLKTKLPQPDEIQQCKLLLKALRGMVNVTSKTMSSHMNILGELLAALKAYAFYGRDDPSINIPACLEPTSGANVPKSLLNPTQPSKPVKGKNKKKTKRRTIRQRADGDDTDEEDITYSAHRSSMIDLVPLRSGAGGSDTELSDPESSQSQISLYQSRVRQYSLTALNSLVKGTDRRVMFGYWNSFLPSSDNTNGSLISILLNDSASKVKIAALAAISSLVEGSKAHLLIATESESDVVLPFTPFSIELGNIIKQLHKSLLSRITKENQSILITQLIKCLSMIIRNTPYQKLKPGILTRAVKLVRPYLSHKDTNVRVSALTCMGAAVSIHTPLLEVCNILIPISNQSTAEKTEYTGSQEVSGAASLASSSPGTPIELRNPTDLQTSAQKPIWLVNTCSRYALSSGSPLTIQLPIRIESLQVLGALSVGYLTLLVGSIEVITNVIIQSLQDTDHMVQLHAAIAADQIAGSIRKHYDNIENSEDKFSVRISLEFWDSLLTGPLIYTLQTESQSVLRTHCCNCLANIGVKVFSNLQRPRQILIITMLLGLSSDPDNFVRSAAVRALGVIVMFPCLSEDNGFVSDAAESIIRAAQETEILVKIKAYWSLANIAESLVLNLHHPDKDTFIEEFPDRYLIGLFKSALSACQDVDKAKYNGTRALGCLLRYIQAKHLENKELATLAETSIHTLIKALTQHTMQARWNACYSIGNLFKSEILLEQHPSWLDQVLSGLCLVMKSCRNFKVRINSVSALKTPDTRYKYGNSDTFSLVWKNLIQAMEEATKVEDFLDYKYVSNLTQNLCELLIHLLSLITITDLNLISALLFGKEEVIKQFIKSAPQHPDITAVIAHIEHLESENMDNGQRGTLGTLKHLVTPAIPESESHTKSKFRPSYE